VAIWQKDPTENDEQQKVTQLTMSMMSLSLSFFQSVSIHHPEEERRGEGMGT
jgi:hypothetical protein